MKPVVTLTISNKAVKSGKNVTIECRAESYPLADQVTDYKLIHLPVSDMDSKQVLTQLLPNHDGVYHIILSASKHLHSGMYECIVAISLDEYPDSTLQSDLVDAYLTVYGELYMC